MTLLPLLFIGCSKETTTNNDVEPPTENAEAYTVSFAFQGDITVSERPLSKAEVAKDLYGINVYYKKDGEDIYEPYGYGLFDNLESMTISLLTGYKYKFVCTMVVEGTPKISGKQQWNSQTQTYYKTNYSAPFTYNYHGSNYNSYNTVLNNKFIIGDNNLFNGIAEGYSNFVTSISENGKENSTSSSSPPIDRYYGETTDYIPQKNGSVTIDLKRTVFGAKFIVEGLVDGELNIYGFSNSINLTKEALSNEAIYTFYDVKSAWQKSDYSQTFTINLTWNRSNGVSQKLDDQQVTFKRNVMTEIKINLNGTANDSGIGINKDNTAMTNENVNINVSGGDQTDTDVNPQ